MPKSRHKLRQANTRNTNPGHTMHGQGSNLTAEEYRTKYLIGGNATHSRLMRYARMLKRDANPN